MGPAFSINQQRRRYREMIRGIPPPVISSDDVGLQDPYLRSGKNIIDFPAIAGPSETIASSHCFFMGIEHPECSAFYPPDAHFVESACEVEATFVGE